MDPRRHGANSKLFIASPSVSCGESNDKEGGCSVGTEMVAEPDLHRELDCCCTDKDGGDGYHTPTSPSRRIPPPLFCPPAPRKPSSSSLRLKRRKKRTSGAEAEESESFASSSPELEDLAPASKKARKMLQWKSVNEEDAAAAAVFELHK